MRSPDPLSPLSRPRSAALPAALEGRLAAERRASERRLRVAAVRRARRRIGLAAGAAACGGTLLAGGLGAQAAPLALVLSVLAWFAPSLLAPLPNPDDDA